MRHLPERDIQKTIERYTNRYDKFGYSPKTLGWDKGKQDIRFDVLTSNYDFSCKTVLDIGCGFGDLNIYLQKKGCRDLKYIGIDLVPSLIEEARKQNPGGNAQFTAGDFLSDDYEQKADFAVASGIFNHKLEDIEPYDLIQSTIEKALMLCSDGLAFDFLSDKVDYRHEHTFHSSPEKVLEIAYKYSRNIVLRNDYMPFEFAIIIFKDDGFDKQDTVFHRYKLLHNLT